MVGEVSGGLTKNGSRSTLPRQLPYLRVANVYANRLELADINEIGVSANELPRVTLRSGDLLVVEGNGSIDQIGRVALWQGAIEPCVHQNHIIKARPFRAELGPWLLYWLLSPEGRRAIRSVASSTAGLHTLSLSKVESLPVMLAPSGEQIRIVVEIEKQSSRLDRAVATLIAVQTKLKRARASVLKAAVEGRLVPTEAALARAEHRSYEPASALLERILTERQSCWPKGKRYQPPAEPKTEDLPDLPEGWAWATVDQVSAVAGGITKNATRDRHKRKVPYLRVANVYANELRLDEIKELGVADSEIDRYLLAKGDLLIVEGNGSLDQIGRAALWNGHINPCIHQNHLIRARPTLRWVSDWTLWWMLSPVGRQLLERTASSTSGLHTLSVSKVQQLAVCLPPQPEGTRIVAEVERRLSVIDNLDHAVEQNLARCGRLRQSILKQAFQGKLVPQDPTDEPASELLARIRAQRAQATA